MKALIPVAGIGTRLLPLTNKVPKVLVNIAGKPMLFHLLDEIVKNGKIDTIILVIGYLGEEVREAVNKHYSGCGVSFAYVEQKEMLGLGHAVYHGKGLVQDEPLFIVLGDTIFEFDMDRLLSSGFSAIGYKDVDDVSRFGIVESKDGFITRMIEKPAPGVTESKSAIAGIYFVKNGENLFRAVQYLMENNIRTKNEFQLTDALMKMVSDGERMIPFEIRNWFDCGKPETVLSTNAYLLKRDHGSFICETAKNTVFVPPYYVGTGCKIDNSRIGPNVTIADGAVIADSEIKNSLLCENSYAKDANLNEVILGNGDSISSSHRRIIKADDKIEKF